MQSWFQLNVRNIRAFDGELWMFYSKLNTSPVGLRGSNFFIIRYPFVGSVNMFLKAHLFFDLE